MKPSLDKNTFLISIQKKKTSKSKHRSPKLDSREHWSALCVLSYSEFIQFQKCINQVFFYIIYFNRNEWYISFDLRSNMPQFKPFRNRLILCCYNFFFFYVSFQFLLNNEKQQQLNTKLVLLYLDINKSFLLISLPYLGDVFYFFSLTLWLDFLFLKHHLLYATGLLWKMYACRCSCIKIRIQL